MDFHPITPTHHAAALCIPNRAQTVLPAVDPHAPALSVMTDFEAEHPVVVGPGARIDDALQDMMRFGVRALVVVEQGAMSGLITAQDIMGERPMQFLASGACTHDSCLHRDVLVADIMTPVAALPNLSLAHLRTARVGDLVETFTAMEQTHLVVIEPGAGGHARLRGLVSRTRLARQLGKDIPAAGFLPPAQAALAVAHS